MGTSLWIVLTLIVLLLAVFVYVISFIIRKDNESLREKNQRRGHHTPTKV